MANRSPFPLEGGYMPCFHRGSHRRELNPPPTPVVAKKVTRGLHCGSSRVATFSLLNTISTKRTRKLFEKLLSDVAHQKVLPPHLPEQIYRFRRNREIPSHISQFLCKMFSVQRVPLEHRLFHDVDALPRLSAEPHDTVEQ